MNKETLYKIQQVPIDAPTTYSSMLDTPLALGRGFDPVDITDMKVPAIEFTEEQLDKGSPKTKLEMLYLSN